MKERYEIVGTLGTGGFSKVYRCYDNNTGNDRCMKVFRGTFEVAKKEAAYLAAINHRCFPLIIDFIDGGDHRAIVMEYIEGIPMSKLIEARTKIFEDIIVHWMKVIAEALHYLHSMKKPIVHGDIKPDNIIIDSYGIPRIIDFSSAMVREEGGECQGEVYGTYGYAPPEQMLSIGSLTRKVDVFGFGMTFDQLIKNCSMGCSIDLKAITKKCTEINPDNRYEGFGEIITEL